MRVNVLYFASLREQRGCSSEALDLQPGLSLADLYGELFGPNAAPVAFSLNQAICAGSVCPQEGDEIAFLPPLGGG